MIIAIVNDLWRNIDSNISLFADDCVIHRKIIHSRIIDIVQTDLNRLWKSVIEHEMWIKPGKSRPVISTNGKGKESIGYILG
jgi:hypothetical protein